MKKRLIRVALLSTLFLFLVANIFAKTTAEPVPYLFKDISSSINGSNPGGFISLGGKLLLLAADPEHNLEPWVSDGTSAGTELLKDMYPGQSSSSPSWLSGVGNYSFLLATTDQGRELWKTDGTAEGTVLVKDINPGPASSVKYWPQESTVMDGILYFIANDGIHGYEVWRSDGTDVGTAMVKDINPSGDSATDSPFLVYNGHAYFSADDGVHGWELWRSDGTANGTVMVKNIHPDIPIPPIPPYPFFETGGWLYFGADDNVHGYELWRTNGTVTEFAIDINPGLPDSYPDHFVRYGGKFYFSAQHKEYGTELWQTDGTVSGTTLVKDVCPGQCNGYAPSIVFNRLVVFNNELYFTATDGVHGTELWKTNGTTPGTTMVKDIGENEFGSEPNSLAILGNKLYFSATTLDLGEELWSTDGTAVGTSLVANIYPGTFSSYPRGLFAMYDKLFFGANDGFGSELWVVGVRPQDLALRKEVTHRDLYDTNNVVTYTLMFQNVGDVIMTGVVITDFMPSLITIQHITNTGAEVTNRLSGPTYVWDVADLAPGEGGYITMTGKFLNTIALGTSVVNVATIHSESEDTNPGNNRAIAIINPKLVFLPIVFK